MNDPQVQAEILLSLGRLEGKVETILTGQTELWQAHTRTGARVDELESKHDRQRGALAVLGILAGVVGSIITFIFRGF